MFTFTDYIWWWWLLLNWLWSFCHIEKHLSHLCKISLFCSVDHILSSLMIINCSTNLNHFSCCFYVILKDKKHYWSICSRCSLSLFTLILIKSDFTFHFLFWSYLMMMAAAQMTLIILPSFSVKLCLRKDRKHWSRCSRCSLSLFILILTIS